jgi:hypothetical protein
MNPDLPTRRLRVIDPDNATAEILAFLERLRDEGERPWCEVVYPAPDHVDPDVWEAQQEDTFDALELVDGDLVTVPPYAELRGDT